jgi:hypothetical protein
MKDFVETRVNKYSSQEQARDQQMKSHSAFGLLLASHCFDGILAHFLRPEI